MTQIIYPQVEGILAVGTNNLIGVKDVIPWSHKADLKNFFKVTKGQALLIGWKTLLGIAKNYVPEGKEVLPGREIFVVGRMEDDDYYNSSYLINNAFLKELEKINRKINSSRIWGVASSDDPDVIQNGIYECLDAIDHDKRLFVAGGATVYDRYMQYANRVYFTQIHDQHVSYITESFVPKNSDHVFLGKKTKSLLFKDYGIDTDAWGIDDVKFEVDPESGLNAGFYLLRRNLHLL